MISIAVLLATATLSLGALAYAARGNRRLLVVSVVGFFSLVLYGLPSYALAHQGLLRTVVALAVVFVTAYHVFGVTPTARRPAARCGFLLAMAVIVGLMVCSLAWSPELPAGVDKIAGFGVRAVLPVIALTLLAPLDRDDLVAFCRGAVVASVSAAVQLLIDPDPFSIWSTRYSMDPSVHPNAAARDFGIALVLCLPAVLISRRILPHQRMALFGAAGLAGLAMVFTGSRGPLLGVVLGVCGAAALSGVHRMLPRLLLVLVAVVALVGLFPNTTSGSGQITAPVQRIVEKGLPGLGGQLEEGDNYRIQRYELAVRLFEETQFAGVGVAGFGRHWYGPPPGGVFDGREYPHNLVLEVACELGIFGLLALFAMVFLAARGWRRLSADEFREVRAALVALWIYAAVSVSVSGDLGTNGMFFVASAVLALAGSRGETKTSERQRTSLRHQSVGIRTTRSETS